MKRTLKNIMMFLAVADLCTACAQDKPAAAAEDKTAKAASRVERKETLPPGWTEIDAESEGFVLAMAYADIANFTHRRIYDCPRCLLRPEVAGALRAAGRAAQQKGLKIVIYDAYRPLPYQQKMYDIVPDKRYVADPAKGSMHNRGAAVDVGLANNDGSLLDMGTAFDDFSERASYACKGLSAGQKQNRKILRTLMTDAGFEPYEAEWWHFNYKEKSYPLSDYLWPCL